MLLWLTLFFVGLSQAGADEVRVDRGASEASS